MVRDTKSTVPALRPKSRQGYPAAGPVDRENDGLSLSRNPQCKPLTGCTLHNEVCGSLGAPGLTIGHRFRCTGPSLRSCHNAFVSACMMCMITSYRS